jgi:hypothetical protein
MLISDMRGILLRDLWKVGVTARINYDRVCDYLRI